MSRKNFIIAAVILSVLSAATFYGMLLKKELASTNLPVLGQVNDFTLVDSRNLPFGLKDLRGKVWVANFIFTTCSGLCPLMTKNMAQLHRSYQLVPEVNLVSFSVNPENDTPPVLASYAKGQNADTRLWHFLTGPIDSIKKIAVESFKVGSVDEPIFHSGKFVLVDRYGNIRGYYDASENTELGKLFKDVSRLLKERS